MKKFPAYVDFIVLGSGIAGLTAALKLAESGQVILATKKHLIDSATELAQGGIAAAIRKEDSIKIHFQDTLRAGAGLCQKKAVQVLVSDGVERVKELIAAGVHFSKSGKGYDYTKEGAHTKRRILHADDSTGEEIARVLIKKVNKNRNISVYENCQALDLIEEAGVCYGAIIRNQTTQKVTTILGSKTIIATGGFVNLYLQNTHPFVCTGDGIAMAYRAGAILENMEFVQFHPTTLYAKKNWQREPLFLISEATRGEGARLKNILGNTFMENHHIFKDLAPRDIVARAIIKEMKETMEDRVFLDFSELKKNVVTRFPKIYKRCIQEGYDLTRGSVPVAPAAHYSMGGIKTDINGQTSIKNLYAVGEAASTGVHGANRLASNSLLEGLVFGYRAAVQASESLMLPDDKTTAKILAEANRKVQRFTKEEAVNYGLRSKIQKIMWFNVGIIRSGHLLKKAREQLEAIDETNLDSETKNMLLLAKLCTKAALKRKESRGAHYRTDYPRSCWLWRFPIRLKLKQQR